ncbi:MAG: hypothetical protein H0X29_08870 [Parachlamydiaceae bacterium]|nr:hypothetical protein [Parachlamydiaceae bacterium]
MLSLLPLIVITYKFHFQILRGGIEALMHDLMHEDINDWHPRKMPIIERSIAFLANLRITFQAHLIMIAAWYLNGVG